MAAWDDAPQVHAESAAQWRAWLEENHAAPVPGAWLVFWKPVTGRPRVTYEDAILEALCFGWIDSQARSLDDERSALWFTRRRPGSAWSATNKRRLEVLAERGGMTPAGQAVVDAAKADGSWSYLDDVENLVVPDDLRVALDQHGAAATWDGFTESARRLVLRWILDARRPETRATRVEETARLAAQGIPARAQR